MSHTNTGFVLSWVSIYQHSPGYCLLYSGCQQMICLYCQSWRGAYYTKIETMLRHRLQRLHHGLHRKLLSYCYYSSTNCISCCQFPWSNFIMSHPALLCKTLPVDIPEAATRRWPTRTRRRASVPQVSRPGHVARGTWHVALLWVLSRDWRSTFGECSLSLF